MKGLIAADEQGCRPLRIEDGTHLRGDDFRPVFGAPVAGDTDIPLSRRYEEFVRVLKPACRNPIDPNDEGSTSIGEGVSSLWRGTNKISESKASGLEHLVA